MELKPCPFCGGVATFERLGDSRTSTIVRCEDCGCSLENPETFDHGKQWNTRATDPLLKEMAEALEGVVRQLSFGTLNGCEAAEFRFASNVMQKIHKQEKK